MYFKKHGQTNLNYADILKTSEREDIDFGARTS